MSALIPAPEIELARFVATLPLARVPDDARRVVRDVVVAAIGAGIAAAHEDGIDALRGLLRARGGTAQARTLVFGDAFPAHAAAQFNGTMCRALDFCDAMAPGPHIGSALVPACLAAAGARGGVDGSTMLAALAAGCEVGARFNLTEHQYAGLDPTGIAVVFAAAAGASRVLGLSERQTLHALALAFNRCAGSFQSHIDGSLGVRVLQGWVAQTGVECAELARAGLTGPHNFLTGIYGYPVLYGRGEFDAQAVVAGLAEEWRLHRMMFKPYPSCGATQGLTALLLDLRDRAPLSATTVRDVEIRLPPYSHRLVGKPFTRGDNPRVDAQFSAAWCAANAIVRGACRLEHFRPEAVANDDVVALARRVRVLADPALDARGHTAVDVRVHDHTGQEWRAGLDVAPGFPGRALSREQHRARYDDCIAYAPRPPAAPESLLEQVESIERLADATTLIDATLA